MRHGGLTGFIGLMLGALAYTMVPGARPDRPSSVSVIVEDHHDVSRPLREVAAGAGPAAATKGASPALPAAAKPNAAPRQGFSALLNFAGVAAGIWAAPDPNGAVGATQYVQWVNTKFAVYDKTTGHLLLGPLVGKTIWAGFGGVCETSNQGDVIAQYDKLAGRWVMTVHAGKTANEFMQCVAVSTTSDATGTFNRYAFQLTQVFADYPKLGVWPDAYYMSIDQSVAGSLYALACALDRTSMLAGIPATAQCFSTSNPPYHSLLPSDVDGTTPPPAGSPDYFLNLGTDSLNLWQFHVDFQTPANSTFTGPTVIPVDIFTQACNGGICVPQLATTQQLDSLGDRVMYRLAYRNFASQGFESLVVNHSVGTPSGIRWYEIRDPGGTPIIFQSGTFSPDSNYRWMGSIAMDKVGDIMVGYSISSATMHPGIRFTGRAFTDPLGTLRAERTIIQGGGSQQAPDRRWGDYSAMTVDPVDDCTFWYTNEWLKMDGINNWKTRIASMKFASCH